MVTSVTSDGRTPLQVADAIAAALGDGWTAAPIGDGTGGHQNDAADVVHRDGRRLFVRVGGRDNYQLRGKVEVSGSYPREAHSRLARGPERFATQLADHRSSEAMAGEIRRRILPRYGPELVRVTERLEAMDRAAGTREEAVAAVMATLPGAYVVGEEVRWYASDRPHGDVRLSHNGATAEVKISGLPLEQALAILRLVVGA